MMLGTHNTIFYEKVIRHKLHAILVVSFLLFVSSLVNSARVNAESLDNLMAIVKVEQSRSFGDIARLEKTLKSAPLAQAQLLPGSSPSELIKNTYGFGSSDSKEAYELIERRILDLNNAPSPTRLRAGRVIVPDLPILTSRSVEAFQRAEITVRNSSRPIPVDPDAPYQFSYAESLSINHPIKDTLVYDRVELYSASEAVSLIEEARSSGSELSSGMEVGIQLSSKSEDCAKSPSSVLSKEDKHVISNALKVPVDNTERYVVVLDTGWPTFEHMQRSLKIMHAIFDKVKRGIRLPDDAITRGNKISSSRNFSLPSHSHACMIHRSLQEFVELDQGERIKLVLLPLRPGQEGSRDLFREIIELDQVIQSLGGLFHSSPSPYQINSAKEFAEKALTKLPALTDTWAAGDDVVRIYEPIISGLIRIFDVYTRIDPGVVPGEIKVDARFWLSLSWNFTRFEVPPALPLSDSYMVFAAAGNDGQDFVAARRLFASEATMGWRVFAVMNSDPKVGGLTCQSALFQGLWSEGDLANNIGSFPGHLDGDPTHPCPGSGGGTSFSTPRLAWLAAASDTASKAKASKWTKTISLRLLKSREKVSGDPHAAPIRVAKLFAPK